MINIKKWLGRFVLIGVLLVIVYTQHNLQKQLDFYRLSNIQTFNIVYENTHANLNIMQALYDKLTYRVVSNWLEIENLNNIVRTNQQEIKENIQQINIQISAPNIDELLQTSVLVGTFFGEGSGTVIKKEDNKTYILTCYHVIDIGTSESSLQNTPTVARFIIDEHGKLKGQLMYAAEIVKIDEMNDLALLMIFYNDDEMRVSPIAKQHPKKGDEIYSVGNPLGYVGTVSKAILSNIIEGFYITDGTITFGNSGGGLYNKEFELIGVPSRVPAYPIGQKDMVPESGLGNSIDLYTIREFLKGTVVEDIL